MPGVDRRIIARHGIVMDFIVSLSSGRRCSICFAKPELVETWRCFGVRNISFVSPARDFRLPARDVPAESVRGSIEVKSSTLHARVQSSVHELSLCQGAFEAALHAGPMPFLRLPLGPGLTGGGDFRNSY